MNKTLLISCLYLILGIYVPSAEAQEQSESSSEIAPSFGTVPGIYYDPDAGLSPSLSQMTGASESGSIEGEAASGNFNAARAWEAGSTPDEIVKVGDIENNPELEGFISISDSTFGEVVLEEGTDVEDVPLQDIGLINNLTVNNFLETFPQYENLEASEFPILRESFDNIDQVSSESDPTRTLSDEENELVTRLANEPTLSNISLSDSISGDWGDSITAQEQTTLTAISEQYPELEQVPLNRLFPETNNQDWQSIIQESNQFVAAGENITTSELLENFPELGNVPLSALPVEDLTVADLEGLSETPLDEFAEIDNQFLSDLGNLSDDSGSLLGENSSAFVQGIPGDVLARIDIPFAGEVETPIDYVLSGGTRNQTFTPEPCSETSCKHFEVVDLFSGVAGALTGLGEVQGKAWIQGSSQSVPGGKGSLQVVNGGMERTGVSVWTPATHTKISLEDIDEGGNGEESTATIWLDFQICVYDPTGQEHCTPHFLSFATPWKIKAGGVMVVFSQTTPAELLEQGLSQSTTSGGQIEESEED